MAMEELFRLARTTTVAQILERDDFAKRFAARAADLACSSCSTRCCRATTRSRCAPTSSSAAPTRRSTCCSAATSSAPTASPSRRSSRCRSCPGSTASGRCRSRSATTSASPSRPRRSTARRCAARRGDGRAGIELLLGGRAAGRRRPRATPSARSRAALVARFHDAEAARRGRGALRPRLRRSSDRPRRSTRSRSPRRRAGPPAGAASPTRFGALALGGAAAAGPGRRALDGEPLAGGRLDLARRAPRRARPAGRQAAASRAPASATEPSASAPAVRQAVLPGARSAVGYLRPYRRARALRVDGGYSSRGCARSDSGVLGSPEPCTSGFHSGSSAQLYCHAPSAPRAPARESRSEESPPEEARRSLKTQQHAHLGSNGPSRCASRFDPSGHAPARAGRRTLRIEPRR